MVVFVDTNSPNGDHKEAVPPQSHYDVEARTLLLFRMNEEGGQ